jgi:cephalosporin-C deacetylase
MLGLCLGAASSSAIAFKVRTEVARLQDDISIELAPQSKDALFHESEAIVYKLALTNNLKEEQSGKITFSLISLDHKPVYTSSVPVNLKSNIRNTYKLDFLKRSTGVYQLQVCINLSEYDDTLRKVCVVNAMQLQSRYARPADFDQFWDNARSDLAKVAPAFKMTPKPDLDKGDVKVYLVEMQSLGNLTVRGWLTMPKKLPKRKMPVWLALPGYQVELKPIYGSADVAVITLNVRGQGNSKDVINVPRNDFITLNIEDKNKYVFKGVLMDCVRMLDFICSREEFDNKAIFVTGGSMGGYLALATASLDERVKLCSAQNPVFCDWRALEGNTDWPMKDVKYYSESHQSLDRIFATLDYFDLKNFVPKLKCKTILGMSLLDPLAPPYNVLTMYNGLKAPNKLFVYPNLTHEVPKEYTVYETLWMMDNLALY